MVANPFQIGACGVRILLGQQIQSPKFAVTPTRSSAGNQSSACIQTKGYKHLHGDSLASRNWPAGRLRPLRPRQPPHDVRPKLGPRHQPRRQNHQTRSHRQSPSKAGKGRSLPSCQVSDCLAEFFPIQMAEFEMPQRPRNRT